MEGYQQDHYRERVGYVGGGTSVGLQTYVGIPTTSPLAPVIYWGGHCMPYVEQIICPDNVA